MTLRISIVDDTHTYSKSDMDAFTRAANLYAGQVERVYGPAASAQIVVGGKPTADTWMIHLMHDSDQADALAYHEVDQFGHPNARVFVDTLKQAGADMFVGLTHELGEMLVDPNCVDCTQITDSRFVAREICDPVEADRFAWEIPGTGLLGSDFVTPAWFSKGFLPTTPVSFNGGVSKPLTLAPGGYAVILDTGSTAGWRQVMASEGDGTSRDASSVRAETAHRVRRRTFMTEIAVLIGNDLEGIPAVDSATEVA